MQFNLFDKDEKTDKTKEDGTNPGVPQPVDEAPTDKSAGEAQQADAGKPDAPFHGFDDKGYFVVRVHSSFGYIFILGWLLKSADWIKMWVSRQVMEDKESKSIIKPGFRGFNPFKKGK